MNYLKSKGIQTRPFFYPMNKQRFLKNIILNLKVFPISENISKYGIYLPSGPDIKLKDIEKLFRNK